MSYRSGPLQKFSTPLTTTRPTPRNRARALNRPSPRNHARPPPTHHARHTIGRSCHARHGREQAPGQSWAADLPVGSPELGGRSRVRGPRGGSGAATPSSSLRSSRRDLLLCPRAPCLQSADPAARPGGRKTPRREGPAASWGRPARKEEDTACLQPLELVRAPRLPPIRGSGRPPGGRKTPRQEGPTGKEKDVVGRDPLLRASSLSSWSAPRASCLQVRV
jgi:hypothetical protein